MIITKTAENEKQRRQEHNLTRKVGRKIRDTIMELQASETRRK